jgi:hypothetical protein
VVLPIPNPGILVAAAQTGTSFATLAAGTYELTQTNDSCFSLCYNNTFLYKTNLKGIGLGWDNGVPSVNKKILT